MRPFDSPSPSLRESVHDPLRFTRCAHGPDQGIVGAPASWTACGLPPLFRAPGLRQPIGCIPASGLRRKRQLRSALQDLAENGRFMGRSGRETMIRCGSRDVPLDRIEASSSRQRHGLRVACHRFFSRRGFASRSGAATPLGLAESGSSAPLQDLAENGWSMGRDN